MTSREAFEKAITKGYNKALKKSAVKVDENGEYECEYMVAAWQGWEASQAQQASLIENLRQEIKQLGEISDICTYNSLGNVCSNCRCKRKVKGK